MKRKTPRLPNYRKKSIELAKKIVRSKGVCEYCGKTEGQMQGSHVFNERGYSLTAADLNNIVCLCATCHKWGRHAWHKGPEVIVWFFLTHTKRYKELEIKAHLPGKPDWKATFEGLENSSILTKKLSKKKIGAKGKLRGVVQRRASSLDLEDVGSRPTSPTVL